MDISADSLRVYAVTDRRWLDGRTLEEVTESILKGGATIVQLREKHLDDEAFVAEAMSLKALCGRYGVPLIINDNLEVARRCGYGIHVGQGDAPLAFVRETLGREAIIGVSCTTLSEALEAEAGGADYLGVGAMFPTGTKDDAADVSLSELTAICHSVHIPVVAIGGITLANASSLLSSGIAGFAVVSALYAAAAPEEAARAFRRIGGWDLE